MTPGQMRITIAEACGWKECFCKDGHLFYGKDPQTGYEQFLPDYINDLNAMNEAENSVIRPNRLWYKYCLALPGRSFDESIGATAYERAEAFIITIS